MHWKYKARLSSNFKFQIRVTLRFKTQTPHQNISCVSANERLIDDLSESYGLWESTADKRSRRVIYTRGGKWELVAPLYWLCEESLSNESVNEPRRSFSFCSTGPFSDGFALFPFTSLFSLSPSLYLSRFFLLSRYTHFEHTFRPTHTHIHSSRTHV